MAKSADALAILQSARVAELRTAATEVAALCRRPVPVDLPKSSSAGRRRLLLLIARERRRNAKLVELLRDG
jgi:hypothetical protein